MQLPTTTLSLFLSLLGYVSAYNIWTCSEPNFGGECRLITTGWGGCNDLGDWGKQISSIGPDSGGWCDFWPAGSPSCHTTAGYWKYITYPGIADLGADAPALNKNVGTYYCYAS
ncbi:uncharacterized protein BDZ99DRAFT_525739 [Mytilinidion resinicola]|uniref:Uncharacterized protein n=1 Tax=Mytilinidion resinicola TaxID=574789 RepID=A0A6A6Y8K0_9PEZI|nr:uncharacterized protein BDZ99DRAFT_525739 [Mytilinidion resinicola]KAF2804147.1 hypothetical protein BDZ99DRAFT_525739 [Mytilinidion resinicola]